MKVSPSVKVDALEKKTTAAITPAQAGANQGSNHPEKGDRNMIFCVG